MIDKKGDLSLVRILISRILAVFSDRVIEELEKIVFEKVSTQEPINWLTTYL